MVKDPLGACQADSESQSKNSGGLPPIDKSFSLDRDRFKRIVPMLAVGLLCNAQTKQICAKLHPYFPSYIRIPKMTYTFRDTEQKLRKLMLIEHGKAEKGTAVLLQELQSLDVDVRMSPCILLSDTNNEMPPDERESSIANTSVMDGGAAADATNTVTTSKDPPILTVDRLQDVRSPGLLLLQLTYDNFNLEQILKALLPDHVAPVSGFTIMGHVAHFNLKPDALPYRHVIGQVVMDKVANIRTVIHKAANIASDFRTFEMDLMAGEPEYITSVCENQLVYHLDVSKVYWNSRLSTEHTRVVDDLDHFHSLDPKSVNPEVTCPPGRVVVYDVFAGVGPFAIPAARRGCRVFANDLNPSSYEWLLKNVEENRSSKRRLDNITCYNLDGREFIRKVVLPHYWSSVEHVSSNSPYDGPSALRYVVIMNLPALAPDFLDAFLHPQSADELLTPNSSILDSSELSVDGNSEREDSMSDKRAHSATLPLDFYCYCFVRRKTESEETVKQRIAVALGCAGQPEALFNRVVVSSEPAVHSWSFRFVRNVAPFKDMFCAQFQLTLGRPETVLEHKLSVEGSHHLGHKKPKLED
ncbi:tRNA (guanine(37)-N1)-methyltransferase [Fasciola hepatica]|uniref:tRNA (guanine(37)-N1)-methyltransferase n=1 Tax=Fasciola hepatica TaxID=6192 RepID=A0A4E0RUN7_FASHE|nr:tRNA (guanine(37)-N1)-methyltransferase [Fasciola hepatica]